MPMHIYPSIDTDPGPITTTLSQMAPITNSLSPATQTDVLAILQREQDHAMSLLSISPLLSSLFISYANRAAALESASATPSSDSEEWKALQATVTRLRGENGKLESENREMAGKLEAATSSQEAFRILVATLKEDAEVQQDGLRILMGQCAEGTERYNRLVEESSVERAAFQAQILELQARQEDLKVAVVGQQIKISKLERQDLNNPSNLPTAATPTTETREPNKPENSNAGPFMRNVKIEHPSKEAEEQTEKAAREKMDEVARVRADTEAAKRAEREVKENAERQAEEGARVKAEVTARRIAQKEAMERMRRETREREENEKAERETKEKSEREAKEREEGGRDVSALNTPSALGLSVRKNDRSRKTSTLSQKDQKNEWAGTRDTRPTNEQGPSGLPPISTSDASSLSDSANNFDFLNVPSRFSASSSSENGHLTDAEQRPSPTEPPPPAPLPGLDSKALVALELLGTQKGVIDEAPTTPNPGTAPSLDTARHSPAPTPPPAQREPEKPLSLWERKERKVEIPPAPAVCGDASGGGNGESIAMPAIVGDRRSVFTDTARGRERENQRENVIEGLLGSGSARRRNDSAQSQSPTKPSRRLAPAPQKASGWGSWGSSLINNIASAVADADRSPSPEPRPVKPSIENPPRGFTPSQPPKSQPAGFGSVNKPAWGAGGTGETNAWGAAKTGPTPIAQKTSTGPAWGAKPVGSTFGSGATSWGTGTTPSFGTGPGRHLSVDTATKPLESSPNTAGPENVPESAIEIKHLPVPGRFSSAIVDQEVATPTEEEGFDWANTTKKKKSQANSLANIPSMPNTPCLDGASGGTGGGGGGRKKKRR